MVNEQENADDQENMEMDGEDKAPFSFDLFVQ
jgi:hypothetical protein